MIANVHIISGTRDDKTTNCCSVVPGNTPLAKERFKKTALRNTIMQTYQNNADTRNLVIVVGDVNLGKSAVDETLAEVVNNTQQTFSGRSVSDGVPPRFGFREPSGFPTLECGSPALGSASRTWLDTTFQARPRYWRLFKF